MLTQASLGEVNLRQEAAASVFAAKRSVESSIRRFAGCVKEPPSHLLVRELRPAARDMEYPRVEDCESNERLL